MNSKLALSAIVVVAAIMAFGVVSPAMAAPNENASDRAKDRAGDKGNTGDRGAQKITICHVEEDDPATEEDESSVDLITVSANSAHNNSEKHPLDYAPTENEDGTLTCEVAEPEPEPIPEGV